MLVTNYYTNTLFSYFSSFIIKIFTLTSQYFKKEQAGPIKKSRYCNYKKRDYISYDCPNKRKIAAFLENINKNSRS